MTQINQLPLISTPTGNMALPAYDTDQGNAGRLPLATLLQFFTDNFASPDFTTILSSPISGFNQVLGSQTTNVWLVLTPAGTLASGTVTLPPVADCFDGQQVLITSSQQITALTIAPNGATLVGAPSTLGAGGAISLRFEATTDRWFVTTTSQGSISVFSQITLTSPTDTILDANGKCIVQLVPDYVLPATPKFIQIESGSSSASVLAKGASGSATLNISGEGGGGMVAGLTDGPTTIQGDDVTVQSGGPTGTVTIESAGASGGIDIQTTSAPIAITAGDEVSINALNAVNISAGAVLTLDGTAVVSTPAITAPTLILTPVAFASLPAAATVAGGRATINNCSTAVFHAAADGFGALTVPVYSTGAAWLVG